jgi:hypothetical protein
VIRGMSRIASDNAAADELLGGLVIELVATPRP